LDRHSPLARAAACRAIGDGHGFFVGDAVIPKNSRTKLQPGDDGSRHDVQPDSGSAPTALGADAPDGLWSGDDGPGHDVQGDPGAAPAALAANGANDGIWSWNDDGAVRDFIAVGIRSVTERTSDMPAQPEGVARTPARANCRRELCLPSTSGGLPPLAAGGAITRGWGAVRDRADIG